MISWTIFSQASPCLNEMGLQPSGMDLKTRIPKKRTFLEKGGGVIQVKEIDSYVKIHRSAMKRFPENK